MHLLLPICGKFTRAQIAHQIFSIPDYVELSIPCYCFPDYGMASAQTEGRKSTRQKKEIQSIIKEFF
jgi:hypothetical protein